MRNKHDPAARLHKRVYYFKKFEDFVWRKNRRWFVKHDDLRITQQHLDNLDSLLHTNRQIFDNCIRIQIQAVLFRNLAHHFARLINMQPSKPASWLDAQHNIFGNCKNWHQHKVLMHHANTRLNGVGGRSELDHLIINQDLSFIGLIHAIQHAHQG